MDAASISKLRTGSWAGRSLTFLPRTHSTNDDARRLAEAGALSGTVIIADHQTAGRGRRGSDWVSPPGKNLLCSMVIRPALDLAHWPRLTHAAALAVTDTLQHFGLECTIKWPNDIFVRGKKIAGLLLESMPPQAAILGIGLNINLSAHDIPESFQATSMAMELATPCSRENVAARLFDALESRVTELESGGFSAMLGELKTCSHLLGKAITLHSAGKEIHTTALDLGPDGELITQSTDGTIQSFLVADFVRLAPSAPAL